MCPPRNQYRRRKYPTRNQTIMMLLQAVRAHAGLALWPTGEQALANTQRLIDMARQFERSASSFRAFVNKLDLEANTARQMKRRSSKKEPRACG